MKNRYASSASKIIKKDAVINIFRNHAIHDFWMNNITSITDGGYAFADVETEGRSTEINIRASVSRIDGKPLGEIEFRSDHSSSYKNEDFEIVPLWETEKITFFDNSGNILESREVRENVGCFSSLFEAIRDEESGCYRYYRNSLNDEKEWTQPIVNK